ncbi:helical backbone metal receptor [Intrasporangium calvum]|uniref:Periplasmic binding protein n=1 Tax=Intrasporangium calvum (strain ATCC 23552 / DSM 43043 / JCM 3097 / NBRC 12989 / NCIMB 10167 / NRRL B-3866 / 7 KIP) TaxID=710696 RepID=E6S9R7_INTC7|nr:helical backbone metal receptor [Intrasporangium calvum]ADU49305.1 periplasmic binding protein [Intrasporangium calvum DSM 43043]
MVSSRTVLDDLGYAAELASSLRRLVSLVPSITEAVAVSAPDLLVGATDWCTHPSDLDVPRVRGTKNPDLTAIRALQPDLVLANKEENREIDVRRLRESGVPVYVTDIVTIPGALDSLERLFAGVLRTGVPDWLRAAREEWSGPVPEPRLDVAIAIWRDPWMVVGSNTYTGDLVARLGWRNVFDGGGDRYPHVELAELDRSEIDIVLLPDEPYVFTSDDGPEAFTRTATALCSGRLLTWYGPAMVGARAALTDQVAAGR